MHVRSPEQPRARTTLTSIAIVAKDDGEIPCVGAICIDEHRRILLIQRGQEPAMGQWSLPGGRVEREESAEQAVVREVWEETGLTVRVGSEVGTVRRAAPSGGTYVIRDFLVTPEGGDLCAGDDARDVRWVPLAELEQWDTSAGLIEALDSWGLRANDTGQRT